MFVPVFVLASLQVEVVARSYDAFVGFMPKRSGGLMGGLFYAVAPLGPLAPLPFGWGL
jgi:hypothetical protein